MNILAEGFGAGEGALAAAGVLSLAFIVVSVLVKDKLKEPAQLKAEIAELRKELADLKTALALAHENATKCEGLERRITETEKQIAVAGAARMTQRLEKVEDDVRGLREQVGQIKNNVSWIRDFLEGQSGKFPTKHNRRHDDPKGEAPGDGRG